jgi:hypothetical protein
MNVDKEWQIKCEVRAFKTRENEKYAVSANHFKKFCYVPSLDCNIEEGTTDSKTQCSKSSATRNWEGHFDLVKRTALHVIQTFVK